MLGYSLSSTPSGQSFTTRLCLAQAREVAQTNRGPSWHRTRHTPFLTKALIRSMRTLYDYNLNPAIVHDCEQAKPTWTTVNGGVACSRLGSASTILNRRVARVTRYCSLALAADPLCTRPVDPRLAHDLAADSVLAPVAAAHRTGTLASFVGHGGTG